MAPLSGSSTGSPLTELPVTVQSRNTSPLDCRLSVLAAVMVPAALCAGRVDKVEMPPAEDPEATFRKTLQMAFGHSGYVTMALAFFVCGLQLVFMTNHLPNYLAVCGLPPSLSATALALIGLFNPANRIPETAMNADREP